MEPSWSVLEPSWSCLGAAAAFDAAFDAAAAASKLLRIDLQLLRSAPGSILSRLGAISKKKTFFSLLSRIEPIAKENF